LKFVVFSEPSQAPVIALWIAHTWVIDAFRITPYIFICSPTKRSGKSRLLECLAALVCRPWTVVGATEATLMRKISLDRPTLLFDEIDAIYNSVQDRGREGLRAVFNCGFARGAKVPRCAGRELIEYEVFCAKAIAGIGDRLPDTVLGRSIRIKLRRRSRDQVVEKLTSREIDQHCAHLVAGLKSLAEDDAAIEYLASARCVVPKELGDRAADIAEPLVAIADLAGGVWPATARTSLVSLLSSTEDAENAEPGIRLLAAIREVFASEGKRQLSTIQILRRLAERDEEETWTLQWPRELGSSNARGPAARMSSLLRPYGVSSGTIRLPDGTTPKGYRLEAFTDAFSRYLQPLPQNDATTPHANMKRTPETGEEGGQA
jgi:hypothetical protein